MRHSSGQASVEFVALLPLMAVALAARAKVCVAGHAAWAASQAASSAARASAVGADPQAAARRALPPHLEDGLRVSSRDGTVRVRLRAPSLLPALDLGDVTAEARW